MNKTTTKEAPQDQEKPKNKKNKLPKGGCPFMQSDKKKNPGLGSMIEAFNEEFISS
jgi:hypothetical protein